MFQPGDDLRFGFKAANEIGLIGKLGQNDLDRYLSPDPRLVGPIDLTEATCPDEFL